MISGVGFTNFQGFEYSQTVRLAPLTLVFGPNSSGKSSILRALRLLAQVSPNEPGLPLSGRHIEMGTYRSAVFNGDEERTFTIATEMLEGDSGPSTWRHFFRRGRPGGGASIRQQETSGETALSFSKVRFEFEIDAVGGGVPRSVRIMHDLRFVDRGSSGATDAEVSVELLFSRISDEGSEFRISELSGLGKLMVRVPNRIVRRHAESQDEPELPVLTDEEWTSVLGETVFGLPWGLVPVGNDRRGSARNRDFSPDSPELEEIAEDLHEVSIEGVERYLEVLRRAAPSIDLSHVGPLRSISQNFQALEQTAGLKSDASNLVSFLAGLSEPAMGQLSDWLRKMTGGRYTMGLTHADIGGALDREDGWRDTGAVLYQVGLKDHHTKTYISPQNAGVGLSQVLPILGVLARLSEERAAGNRGPISFRRTHNQPLVIIEQPELHLHPRMQADFAEVLVDAFRSMSRKSNRGLPPQIVVETHSEALLMRIQKLIRQGKIEPSDLSVLFVDQFAGGGNLAQELRLDEEGNFIDTWPTSFSEVRWSEQLDD